MKKILLALATMIALVMSACASSATVVEQAEIDGPAVNPTPTFDPMATVAPTVTPPGFVAPAPTPTPTPSPTPTPQPAVVLEPTSAPATEPGEPAVEGESASTAEPTAAELYTAAAKQARSSLNAAPFLLVSIDRTFVDAGSFDFSFQAEATLDSVARSNALQVSFSGADWLVGGPGGWVEPPWRLRGQDADADVSVDRFGMAVTADPGELRADLVAILELDGAIEQVDATTFRVEIDAADLLRLKPGSSVSPWTSVLALVAAAGTADVNATAPVQLSFTDGRVSTVVVDYRPVLVAIAETGATFPFSRADFRETYTIEQKDAAPAPTATAEPAPVLVGDCFARQEFLDANPVTTECDQLHGSEVIYVDQFDDGESVDYPGREALTEQATEWCTAAFQDVTGVAANDSLLTVSVVVESPEGWAQGARRGMCVVAFDELVSQPLSAIDVQRIGDRVADLAIRRGDCFTGGEAFDQTARLVDCDEGHHYQAYATSDIEDAETYPGVEAIDEEAQDYCQGRLDVALQTDEREWLVNIRTPTEDGWVNFGDRRIVCLVSADELLVGSAIETS